MSSQPIYKIQDRIFVKVTSCQYGDAEYLPRTFRLAFGLLSCSGRPGGVFGMDQGGSRQEPLRDEQESSLPFPALLGANARKAAVGIVSEEALGSDR